MLTPAEINDMRATAETTFDSTAIIQTRAYVSDGGGGGTTTWTAAGTVPCHLSPATSRQENAEPEIGERLAPDADWIATIPAETTVGRSSRIVVAGTSYEVLAVSAPRTWELTRRVEVNEVT